LIEAPIFELLDLGDEDGFEAWYNFAVTPWLHVTADLQVIDTALGQPLAALSPQFGHGGLILERLGGPPKDSDMAYIGSLRTKLQF
jgi:hypothetical protein